jgi:deazaflavin-dependent oxidoreductase (nitroreductase family)
MAEKRKPAPFTPTEEKIGTVAVRVMSKLNTWIYRASGGRLGAKFARGAPVCLLITTGRKSGQERTAPLIYLKDGADYVFVASKGGMSTHPDWYLNLEARPECAIEIGKQRLPAVAHRVGDDEKAALWPRLLAIYPDYDDYQARTTRNIPVIRLSPR